jgi:FK506-binding nuclear protein
MKKIIIWVAVLLVLLIGVFAIYKSMNKTSDAALQDTTQQGDAATTQVHAQEVSVGTGEEAKPGDTVSVLYVGQLSDGTVFDSSAAHNNEPLTFVLGAEGLIAGFQIGVNGMKVGGERLLSIPPALGYGDQEVKDASGKVIIPAGSTIIFDVKLVKVEAATATEAQ